MGDTSVMGEHVRFRKTGEALMVSEAMKKIFPEAVARRNVPPGFVRVADYDTISNASKVCDIPRTTLRDAAHRGDVDTVTTYGGTVLVRIDSAYQWAKGPRPRGRPSRAATSGLFD